MPEAFSLSNYFLSTTLPDAEQERLKRQHMLLRKRFGGDLVLAPMKLQSGDHVLECGTGTGIWLLDCARDHDSQVQYTGIDIDPRLFPNRSIPDNITFSVGSTLQLPKEWTDKFSLVHQRLMVFAFRIPEWLKVLNELYRVTKPGGFVQLCETSRWSAGPKTEAHYKVVERLFDEESRHLYLSDVLPGLLEQAGFVSVGVEKREAWAGSWAGSDGDIIKSNTRTVFLSLKESILGMGGHAYRSEEEYEEVIKDIGKEMDETPGAHVDYWVFYAQKPL